LPFHAPLQVQMVIWMFKHSKVYFIMERVETLLKKLQDQFAGKASPEQLLLTVRMLHAELNQHVEADTFIAGSQGVAITHPQNHGEIQPLELVPDEPMAKEEEKIIEVLQVNEAEVLAELEELKKNAENIQKISTQNKPALIFDEEEEDVPTLSHQRAAKTEPKKEEHKPATASTTVNEKLKQSRIDLGDALVEQPIRDLRKAIAVNDRFRYINELFRGDEAVYERSIKTINGFSILAEAEYWIQRELKVKHGWKDSDELVKQFYQLVRRRFS